MANWKDIQVFNDQQRRAAASSIVVGFPGKASSNSIDRIRQKKSEKIKTLNPKKSEKNREKIEKKSEKKSKKSEKKSITFQKIDEKSKKNREKNGSESSKIRKVGAEGPASSVLSFEFLPDHLAIRAALPSYPVPATHNLFPFKARSRRTVPLILLRIDCIKMWHFTSFSNYGVRILYSGHQSAIRRCFALLFFGENAPFYTFCILLFGFCKVVTNRPGVLRTCDYFYSRPSNTIYFY